MVDTGVLDATATELLGGCAGAIGGPRVVGTRSLRAGSIVTAVVKLRQKGPVLPDLV